MMAYKYSIPLGVLVVLAAVGFWVVSDWFLASPLPTASLETAVPSAVSADIPPIVAPVAAPPETAAPQGTARAFAVLGANFSFAPSSITAKKGDTVKITFKNTGGFHDFVLDAFNVATKKINGGAEETVTFVADKAGTFEYYCSVGEHRAMGMKGTLTVE